MPLDLKPLEKEELQLKPLNVKLDLKPLNQNRPEKLQLKPINRLNLIPLGASQNENEAFAKMSKFGKVLDILGRPGYAIKSVLGQIQQENLEAFKNIPETDTLARMKILSEQKPQIRERLQAAWRGLSGQERITGNQLWKNIGIEGVPFLGFATEIATDPLMWAGGAGYKLLGKAVTAPIKLAGKGISKIPGVAKAATMVGEKTEPIISSLKEKFITKTGIGKLNEFIDKHLSLRKYKAQRELIFGTKIRNVIQNVSKKTGRSIDDISQEVVNLIELPEKTIASVPETKVLANTIKSHLSNILTEEMKAGVPITSLSRNIRGIQYFPRITTKEAKQYLRQAQIGNSKVWNAKIANALQRKTGDFTLEEFNAFVKAHGLESLGGRSVEEFFMKQPAYAVATRGIRSAKAVTSAQFLDDVGKTFGNKINPGYYEQLPEAVTKLNPNLKGMWFDPEVAGEIARTTKSYINPEETRTFGKIWDSVQNVWKRWTLAPFPKYHLRNMVGNLWNNYLANVNPINYPKAQALQMYRKYKGTGNILEKTAMVELNKFKLTPQMADDIIINAEKTGVLNRGWYAADIETGIEKELQKGFIRQPLGIKVKKIAIGELLTEKGMAVGTTIENNARLAHFIDRLDKGNDVLKSAQSVKKFLFDYDDLTYFEKQIMKRAMPFYTWTRKNIPLQIEQLIKQPQKFAPLAIPLRNREPKDLLRLKYTMPQLYERLPIEFKRTIDTVTYVPLEGLLPAADLSKIVRPQELLAEMISPYLRVPIELAMNKSFYFESEIQRYPKETQELLRMDIPVKLKYVLTTVLPQARLLNEINKIVKKDTRKEKLTLEEQAFSQTLSSIYKLNIKDLKIKAFNTLQKKTQELEKGMFWALRNLRPTEQKRIKETYQEIVNAMKELR